MVDHKRVEEFIRVEGLPYTEVSAKTGNNLGEVFRNLCSKLLDSPLEEMDINQSVVKGLKAPNKNLGESMGASMMKSNLPNQKTN